MAMTETDITKSRILSPVDGIVLKRDAEPGQTVASSFQAPVLFTLAEDLTHMQLEADVDEADIGAVKEGQKATFTRRCLSRPELPGGDRHHRVFAEGHRQRRHLQGGADGGQQRPAAAARHDGDGADRGAGSARRAGRAQCRAALFAAQAGEEPGLQRDEPVHPAHAARQKKMPPPPPTARAPLYVLENGAPKAGAACMPASSDGKDTEILSGDLKAGRPGDRLLQGCAARERRRRRSSPSPASRAIMARAAGWCGRWRAST